MDVAVTVAHSKFLGVFLAVLNLPGCTVDSAEIASVRGTGGRCADGVCRDELIIYGTGRWQRHIQNQPAGEGKLDGSELAGLRRAIDDADVGRLRQAPPPKVCATAYDGNEMTYVVGDSATGLSINSCDHEIPQSDPLIKLLNGLFETLR